MHVRPLRSSDVEAASGLLRQLGYDVAPEELAARLQRVLASAPHYGAVAVDDGGRVVGLAHAYERPALEKPCEAVVQAVVVERGARRSGAGRLLMASVEEWARARGLTHIALHTRADRDDARFLRAARVRQGRDLASHGQAGRRGVSLRLTHSAALFIAPPAASRGGMPTAGRGRRGS
jgi:GNAT superfamily N-acetyltransferase